MGDVSKPLLQRCREQVGWSANGWPRDSEEWRDYRDWQADAREGNTIMGFRDWVANREGWGD